MAHPIHARGCLSGMSYEFDSLLCSVLVAEGDEGVAPILTRERVHHQTQVPDRARLLKQWHQLILIQVSGDLTHKHLQRPKRTDKFNFPSLGWKLGIFMNCEIKLQWSIDSTEVP